VPGWTCRVESPRRGGRSAADRTPRSVPMWEVLKWFGVFMLALLLIVAGLFWLMGRPLPIPQF